MHKWFFRVIITAIIFCLCVGSVSAATELIENGDFSNGLDGWEYGYSTSSEGGSAYVSTYDGMAQFTIVTDVGGSSYAYIEQSSIDLTYVNSISFKAKYSSKENINGNLLYLRVYDATTYEDILTIYGSELTTSFQTFSASTSSKTGLHDIRIYAQYYGEPTTGYLHGITLQITDVSAISLAEAPTYTRATLSDYTTSTSTPVSVSITADAGYPYTQFSVNWGDGTEWTTDISQASGSITKTFTHSYSTPGTYNIYGSVYNTLGSSGQRFIGTVTVATLDFTAYPTSGDPPLAVQFSLSAQNIVSVLWDFGDGTTSTAENPVHTYAASSTPYTVTLTGYTSGGDAVEVTKSDYILASPQTLLFDKSSYEAGETATITWQLREPDFTNYQYTLQILASDSQGNTAGTSIITPVVIDSASSSYTWNTAGASGYYTAAIFRSGTASPIVFATTNIITQATLTVNLAINGVTYTNATTVSVSQNGVIVATQTTTSGQVQFTIPTGAYIVQATTTGYATQQATVNLLESTAVTIDFVTGTTDSTFPSGSGSFYASTFATFRVIDKTYGTEVSGATITGYAVESTNPVEWLANIFGAAWGGKIIGSEVEAITDENGVASFMMFTNVRYSLTLSHPDLPNDVTRTFALSALSTEYPWYVDIPHEKDPTAQTSITTTATVSGDGLINITYNDASKTTSLVTVNVWKKDDENNYTTLMDTTTALGNANTIQLQLTDFSGADVKISVLFTTSAFGTVERVYYHTFPGPWFDLGLPSSIYIWICLLTAILLGGISPFINSYACCFVICFMEWVYWAFGWFFQIGQPVAAFLLTCATVLSIAYYIASRR